MSLNLAFLLGLMKTGTKAQPFGLHQYIPTELFNREIFVYNVEYEKNAC